MTAAAITAVSFSEKFFGDFFEDFSAVFLPSPPDFFAVLFFAVFSENSTVSEFSDFSENSSARFTDDFFFFFGLPS